MQNINIQVGLYVKITALIRPKTQQQRLLALDYAILTHKKKRIKVKYNRITFIEYNFIYHVLELYEIWLLF